MNIDLSELAGRGNIESNTSILMSGGPGRIKMSTQMTLTLE